MSFPITFAQDGSPAVGCAHCLFLRDFFYPVAVAGDIKFGCPLEFPCLVIDGLQRKFHALIADFAVVARSGGVSAAGRYGNALDAVGRIFPVYIEIHIQPVFQYGKFDADIRLLRSFPRKVGVGKPSRRQARLVEVRLRAGRPGCKRIVIADTVLVSGISVTCAEFQGVKNGEVADEFFLSRIPCKSPCGETKRLSLRDELPEVFADDTSLSTSKIYSLPLAPTPCDCRILTVFPSRTLTSCFPENVFT